MAKTSSIKSDGTLFTSVSLDEVTQSTISESKTYLRASEFDEVTISPLANGLVRRKLNDGRYLIAKEFDEVTKSFVDNNLIVNFDASIDESYSGSNSTWFSLVTPQYNATLINSPIFSNRAFIFNGSSQYAEISHNAALKPTIAITMEQWIASNNWNEPVAGNYDTSLSCTQGGGYAHYIWDGLFRSYVRSGGGYRIPTVNVSSFANESWHHLVTTFDGRYTKIYVDGILGATDDMTSSGNAIQYAFNNSVLIGAEATSTTGTDGFYWNGKISVTRIYNRALNAEEVLQNFNASKSRYGL